MKPTPLVHASPSPSLFRLLLLFVFASAAYAQPATKIHLAAPAHGAAAIAALADHLPEVARAYGLQTHELTTLFQTQPSLGVDREGALLFSCNGLTVPAHGHLVPASDNMADAMPVDSSLTAIASGATVDAFKLHSLPGCTRVIYLDFTGHTTSGTSWNSSYGGGAPIVSAPFDQDGDPTTFSTAERGVIQRIWQRVAEDYAPFTVDVTTEDPGLEGLRRTDSSDAAYGTHVVISPTNWYSTNAGGVSYIGSFNWNSDTPSFVFTQQLANAERYIAECCSHETGHSVGLYHDGLGGSAPTEYYQGQGNWAPIMGNSYYKAVTQFSKGEYTNANNLQDDFAVVATYVPINDDHGNTLATASVLIGPTIFDGGTIETRGDVDVFRFDTGAGAVTLNINSPSPSPNLDIKAELLNSSGQVLQTSDSLAALNATLSATLAGGTYYLRIDGVGNGDPVTTGYSDYGSVGNYVITGTIVPLGTLQPPLAVISASTTTGPAALAVSFSAANSTAASGTIVSYSWTFGTGATAAGMYPSYTYTVPGTFTATLTVTDSNDLINTASVIITVTSPPNQLPVAVASGTPTSGYAPLPVTFSSAGSLDADGSIVSYSWDFGDGSTATGASPSKIYTVPGNYTAKLTVTDNVGGTASATVPVSVLLDHNSDCDVQLFTLASNKSKAGTLVNATVIVSDRLGRPVVGATVGLTWSGVLSGTTSAKTDAAGKVVITSSRTKKTGSITATLTTVTPPTGGLYDGTIYNEPLVRSTTL